MTALLAREAQDGNSALKEWWVVAPIAVGAAVCYGAANRSLRNPFCRGPEGPEESRQLVKQPRIGMRVGCGEGRQSR
jgi:hypothetical protein